MGGLFGFLGISIAASALLIGAVHAFRGKFVISGEKKLTGTPANVVGVLLILAFVGLVVFAAIVTY